jgi:hypothetical protein
MSTASSTDLATSDRVTAALDLYGKAAAVAARNEAALGATPLLARSLCGGLPGAALLFDALGRRDGRGGWCELAIDCLKRAMARVPGDRFGLVGGLAAGATGLAFCITQAGLAAQQPFADFIARVDQMLLDDVGDDGQPYELLTGLVGTGIYALERLPDRAAVELLEAILERLEASYVEFDDGVAWITPPERLSPALRTATDVVVDLGMAHGVAGIVVLLSGCVRHGIAPARSAALLRDAAGWLAQRELPAPAPIRFPAWFAPCRPAVAQRMAWCYGDLGVTIALGEAAAALADAGLDTAVRRLAGGIADCGADRAGVELLTLCHGGAGMLHGLSRLQRWLPPAVATAARWRWGEWVSARAATTVGTDAGDPAAALGLLEGGVGVALALHGLLSGEEPAWDRALGMSVRSPLPTATSALC